MRLQNKSIFISGATRGIGLALAKNLSKKGNRVVVGGRKPKVLEELKQKYPGLETILFDALKEEDILKTAEFFKENGGLDLLINNAALLYSGDFVTEDYPFEQIEHEVLTNVAAPIKLTKALLPALLQSKEAGIVNITSAVAYLPMKSLPVYSSTKAALQSFTISLRQSLKGTKVNVFEALPPLVATDMTANMPGGAKDMKMITPEECAAAITAGVEAGKKRINIGGSTKSLAIGHRIFPGMIQKQLNKM